MSKKKKISSLLSSKATGGDTAEKGFKYQANLIVANIPIWLADDGFSEIIREALGDVEVKFFNPSTGTVREYIEYKNHIMYPNEFWTEVSHFQEMDKVSVGGYSKFTLSCKDVADSLKSILNGLRRIRDAYPFYDGFQQIQDESYRDFEERVIHAGRDTGIANFIFSKVWFETDLVDAEDFPRELFREALLRNFSIFEEMPARKSNEIYADLVRLVDSRLNQPILRNEFDEVILGNVEPKYLRIPTLRFHTIHDKSLNNAPQGSIVFNWERFFGGSERNFPASLEWDNELIFQLSETKKWILSTNRPKFIKLSGNRRLSASFALGSVFSSVSGFNIQMETKDGFWKTNDYPNSDTPNFKWVKEFRDGEKSNELIIGIGIMKNIVTEVEKFVPTVDFHGTRLYLQGDGAILSAAHNNLAVDQAKNLVLEHLSNHNIEKVHLFMAVPAQFALFLGHRINATCIIQCYERKAPNVYVPSCSLKVW